MLPPPTTTNGVPPRMSTPQNDSGWAGWAISSFTNKINTASGEMQPKPPQAPPLRPSSSTDGRPSLPVSQHNPNTSASASNLHRQAVAGPTAPVLTRTSTEQFFNDAQDEDDEVDEAWGEMDEDSFFDAPSTKPPPAPAPEVFDHGGEPDFEGWLNAQAKAKSKAPLPKGLAKPTSKPAATNSAANGRMPVTRTTTTGGVGTGAGVKKVASTVVKPNVTTPKVIDTKPKEAADDDWGDAWD